MDELQQQLLPPPSPSSPSTKNHHRSLRRCASDRADHTLQLANSHPPRPPPSFLILTPPRAALILLIYLLFGILTFLLLHHGFQGRRTTGIVDALYFCAVTMTTVGYGDLVPRTAPAKLFTCAFVFLGFALIGLIIGNAANFLVEKQQRLLEKAFDRHDGQPSGQPESTKVHLVKHKVMVAGGVVVLVLGVGVAILMHAEGLGFVDAFYCVCVTATTLGYGDQAFETVTGRVCAVFWVLASTACVAQFILYLAELITEERQQYLARWVISRKVTTFDVEAADIDRDGRMSASEFVVYKLKELGKIEDEDVKGILNEFYMNDSDQNGEITAFDLTN